MKADKPKVVDEVWDDARIASFLTREDARIGAGGDHLLLLRAYQGMRPGDFERFVQLFVAAGGNLEAADRHGLSLTAYVATHRHGAEFVQILCAAGAKPPTAQGSPAERVGLPG